MAGKTAEITGPDVGRLGIGLPLEPPRPVATARMRNVTLSGTVLVDYDVTLTEVDGAAREMKVRVEFPDEVRAMLEASTWSRGMTILDVVSRLGAAYIERLGDAGLLRAPDVGAFSGGLSLPPATYHIPLSDLRSNLAAVYATSV